MNKNKLIEQYGFLFEEELIDEMDKVGNYISVPADKEIIDIGDELTHIPLLLSGAIKILREDEDGDELLLYFIEKGDSCAMSFSCGIEGKRSEIRAVSESDSEILMIPVMYMELWMANYRSWRNFVIDSYQARTKELLETVDTIAFLKMDMRILKYLQDKAKVIGNDLLNTTHERISQDLHTSRVVVSRILKKLEKDGKIKLFRNEIKVIEL